MQKVKSSGGLGFLQLSENVNNQGCGSQDEG
jgi:hypothetical protein